MMTPDFWPIITGITRRATSQGPFRLMSIMASHASSVSSWASPYAQIPALLNSTSMRPKRSTAAATAAVTAASSRTSPASARQALPTRSHSATSDCKSSDVPIP
jgi:hypothetical protein